MAYHGGSKLDPALVERERALLLAGLSYPEISALTGGRTKTILERNRVIYKIDIWEAFQRRIDRDGIPNRLAISDAFGYWLSGFFDGEGCITIFTRPCTGRPQYAEYRLHVRIMVRDDDAGAITRIKDNLHVGRVYRVAGHGGVNPVIAWHCERVQDLAEVIIPLFDRYPLYTKKAKEFAIWKPIVLQRYVSTLAGYSNRHAMPENERLAFHQALKAIADIRTYRTASESIPEINPTSSIVA